MRWLTLYARSRRVPGAVVAAAGTAVAMWLLWLVFSDLPNVDVQMVVLTVVLLVAVVTATFAGPDDALERTAALPWRERRAAHVLVALVFVVGLLLGTLATGARFGPIGLVLRDAAGLLGLTVLGTSTVGAARSWFLPVGWTLGALVCRVVGWTPSQVAAWQLQAPGSTAAAVTAGVLGVGGLIVYALAGPARPAPAEAAL
jgi:hypothetical protein